MTMRGSLYWKKFSYFPGIVIPGILLVFINAIATVAGAAGVKITNFFLSYISLAIFPSTTQFQIYQNSGKMFQKGSSADVQTNKIS